MNEFVFSLFSICSVSQGKPPMDILEFAKKLSAGKHHSARNDDVFIDRLNHRYTVTMIIIFAAVVTTQQYFGSPITCWVSNRSSPSRLIHFDKINSGTCTIHGWLCEIYQ